MRVSKTTKTTSRLSAQVFLLVFLLLIPLLVPQSDAQNEVPQRLDFYPELYQELKQWETLEANQQWQSHNLTTIDIPHDGVLVINLDLDTNETGFLGSKLIYKVRLDFAVFGFHYPSLHSEEVTIDRSDEITIIPEYDFSAGSEWYLSYSVLAGDPKSTSIDLQFDLTSYSIPSVNFSPGYRPYELHILPIPHGFVGQGGWAYNTIGQALVLLPENVSKVPEIMDISIEYVLRNPNPGNNPGIGFDFSGNEITRHLNEVYEGSVTVSSFLDPQMQLDVMLKDCFGTVEIIDLVIDIPSQFVEQVVGENLPPFGIILGILLPMLSILINYKIGIKQQEYTEKQGKITEIHKKQEERYGV